MSTHSDLESRADPSWFAHEGYRAATRGRGGVAGHLAWERVSSRFLAERRRRVERHQRFDERTTAWVMGYGLGLSDIGRQGEDPRTERLDRLGRDRLIPRAGNTDLCWRAARLWLSVTG